MESDKNSQPPVGSRRYSSSKREICLLGHVLASLPYLWELMLRSSVLRRWHDVTMILGKLDSSSATR